MKPSNGSTRTSDSGAYLHPYSNAPDLSQAQRCPEKHPLSITRVVTSQGFDLSNRLRRGFSLHARAYGEGFAWSAVYALRRSVGMGATSAIVGGLLASFVKTTICLHSSFAIGSEAGLPHFFPQFPCWIAAPSNSPSPSSLRLPSRNPGYIVLA